MFRRLPLAATFLALIALLSIWSGPQWLSAQTGVGIADHFRYPLDGPSRILLGYGKHSINQSLTSCYHVPYSELFHTAEDWAAAGGTTVYAVAEGVVYWYEPGYTYNPGHVVITEHTLADGSKIYSLYGHLDKVYVSRAQGVRYGDPIGTVYNQDANNNSHLHWEMRYKGNESSVCAGAGVPGAGYALTHPDDFGYTNPSAFIAAHSIRTMPSPRTPLLLNPADGVISNNGLAPTLCWQANPGGGAQVQYYAQAFRDDFVVDSGWTGYTCWRPSVLDGQYSEYQWHVATSRGGIVGDWSPTRRFIINSPDQVNDLPYRMLLPLVSGP